MLRDRGNVEVEGSGSDDGPSYGIAPAGYRLPVETRLGRVRLQIADLARSVDYYVRVLGLRVIDRPPGRTTLGAADSNDPLIELVERRGARPVPRLGRIGLYHFALLLPNRAALGRFLVHLGEIGSDAGMADHAVSEALYLGDPDGLGIEIYADRPRSMWQRRGRELRMTTDPLDVESLRKAANDQRWSGMPAGTTVGHVHLYVRDLEASAAFYHAALGLDQLVWSYPGALFLSAGGYHHHLGTNTWAGDAPLAGPDDARLLEWEVVLPRTKDVDAAARSVEAAGYPAARTDRGWLVADPWGTTLRLVSDGRD